MKSGYSIVKLWLRTGLFFYYTKIKVFGKENIPKGKPLMVLANHQNALMDPLMIAMNCGVKPFFLARSDLFKNPLVSKFLRYLQMIPIYRFRDGRDTLKNNPAIFKKCGDLLIKGETIMLFPEGNHGIRRRVRWPMRYGFVRMLFSALEKEPDLDIRILPIGLNYLNAEGFPDSVSMYIGKDFSVQDYYDPNDLPATESKLKDEIYERLKELTTHIPDEETYDRVIAHLDNKKVDYLKPESVNKIIKDIDPTVIAIPVSSSGSSISGLLNILFNLINFPIVLLWNKRIKTIGLDIEFRTTLRFAMGLILFPIYYLLLYLVFGYMLGQDIALTIFLAHVFFNFLYVKLGRFTSSYQKI
ncbi:MAG: lysophospholipid acyltransferase family protein [Maribacter sp.]|nr:lysophospholipid acyltransferase family protein [Maribacter sp.]